MIQVVAAVIFRGDKILICRRPEGKNLAGFWEFPGGKVEEGESPAAALVRECGEELDISPQVGEPLGFVGHDYGDYAVGITFFRCSLPCGEPVAREHSRIEWADRCRLGEYEFCPADAGMVKKLTEE